MTGKLKVLFLCTGNSCRSQMAEGWARRLRPAEIEAFSAGVEKHGLNPMAVRAMAEAGVDIGSQVSKTVAELPERDFDVVITLCGHARESCPAFPGKAKRIHAGFDDPPALAKSAPTEEEALAHYRRVRDDIRAFVETLPESVADLDPPEIGRILLATDLSGTANRALAYAAGLADAYGARITVLHVVEKLPPNAELLLSSFLGYGSVEELRRENQGELMEKIRSRIQRFCSQAADRLPECRPMLDQVIVEPGKASERILHHAGAGGYDALVMGTRGHGLVKEALLGGTSRKVIRHSPIPVFVIPAYAGAMPRSRARS